MASGLIKLAPEREAWASGEHGRRLAEEYVWAVYCNGRRSGYPVRRKRVSDEDQRVTHYLNGVSMGAGVLPCSPEKVEADGELTFLRTRFERLVGSKDSEVLYMVNPDGSGGHELSIFLVRVK